MKAKARPYPVAQSTHDNTYSVDLSADIEIDKATIPGIGTHQDSYNRLWSAQQQEYLHGYLHVV